MSDTRLDPDELLRAIRKEEKKTAFGRLKIFFGYAAGVGKTYAMLKAAHAAKGRGVDVAVGYVEPHARPKTTALLEGLEVLPLRHTGYNGIELAEFDLEGALARKPQLLLVDELAHTNAPGGRHKKRYQDVEELLHAGIDVYTTVNVQHIESLNDMVASITGVSVQERIPDSVFDGAAQVELVDIEPQDLIDRLSEGSVYREQQAQRALANFFTLENLSALREIALRRCADRMNLLAEATRVQNNSEYYTDEHVLVCLSTSPSNPKIIRTAARMAQAFHGGFTALFVETTEFSSMSEEDKTRLRGHIHLAQQLGASIETVYGDDIPLQIAEFARLSGVSQIVIGRSSARRKRLLEGPSLTEKLIEYAPDLDVYIIPDTKGERYRKTPESAKRSAFSMSDFLKSLSIFGLATLLSFAFYELGFSEANIIVVYILAVLVTAVVTSHRVYSMAACLFSVLAFNFLFTEPRFTLNAYDSGYPATFAIMLAAALITEGLARRIKDQARQSTQAAYRTKVLFDTNQLLQKASGNEEIVSVTAEQLTRLLGRNVVFYLKKKDGLFPPRFFPCEEGASENGCLSANEQAVADWVFKNNKRAGATTDTLSSAKCLYLAVRIGANVYGVAGIVIGDDPLEVSENSVLLSILGECAMALESEQISSEKEEAAVFAKNEQLRANLLRTVSHDLRTPLTSISGNAGVLLASAECLSEERKHQLYTDIYDDSIWLINLVENLLAVTRIEDETIRLRFKPELMDDVITEALSHIGREGAARVQVNTGSELALVKMDARLIVQVVVNLIDNALKYTPEATPITVRSYVKDKKVVTEVSDEGPGISGEAKPHIFEMFYTADSKIADSRRSMGLGLALCKSIINAHGGEIEVADNHPTGTIFRFSLPVEEVSLHE